MGLAIQTVYAMQRLIQRETLGLKHSFEDRNKCLPGTEGIMSTFCKEEMVDYSLYFSGFHPTRLLPNFHVLEKR